MRVANWSEPSETVRQVTFTKVTKHGVTRTINGQVPLGRLATTMLDML